MKKLYTFIAGAAVLFLSTSTADAATSTKAYQPSTAYSNYVYKEYDKKGNLSHLWNMKLVKSGSMKGAWRDATQGDIYTFYDYNKQYGLTAAGGTKHNFQHGSMKLWDVLPATVKKGQTGHLEESDFSTSPYKILSTNATVKTSNGTYKHAIKMWRKRFGDHQIFYYVKNRGCVKIQTLSQGEYKTTYVLYKIKK